MKMINSDYSLSSSLIIICLLIFQIDIIFCSNYLETKQTSIPINNNNYELNSDISNSNNINYKFLTPIKSKNFENDIYKTRNNNNIDLFRESIKNIKLKSKKSDIIFLIDSSSSVGKINFYGEIRFVKKLLKHFNLSFNYSRIALITFSSKGKVIRHIDQISNPSENHDQCSAITNDIPKLKFVGGGTFTYGALKEAKDIFSKARKNSKKYIFLISDGFSNGRNPIEMADELKKKNNVTIFSIGIQSGNYGELLNISSLPKEKHSFLLSSFLEFEKLVRNALRKDHKLNYKIPLDSDDRCNILCTDLVGFNSSSQTCCNSQATCECGIPSGFYSCTCPPGYIGNGLLDDCRACIANTYWVSPELCRSCPDINHITIEYPAKKAEDCICKTGFKKTPDNRCAGITCQTLLPPENGYFVKQVKTCANVLNAACGARCKSGYQLKGTSLRLCQENGTWSGMEASCHLKICPSLTVPYYGMITCKNRDLNLSSYDYSPKNDTFMLTYDDDTKRITEQMPIDTECSYKCGPGYYLVGSKTRNCLPLSKWDGLQTTCKQVLCSPLPKPNYGFYDINECSEIKVPFNTNCSLLCPPGFQLNGPSVKTCQGKKIGVWSQRNKVPKCIDNIPPEIICPKSFSLNVGPTKDSILIKSFPPPLYIADSSGLNVTYWLTPTIDEIIGTHLKIKDHIFTYVASDTFNNKAECNFKVSVVDTTPPIPENCIDPNDFFISSDMNEPGGFIEWDEPTFYDNSNGNVVVTRTLDPGFLTPGKYRVTYEATDPSKNMNVCVLNITVKELSCEKLESPLNGQSICAKNSSHTWCEINCNSGYSIYHSIRSEFLENFRLTCLNSNPNWEFETVPDCTMMEIPNSIEELLTLSIGSEQSICNDGRQKNDLTQHLSDNLKNYLCNDVNDCDIVSEIPECIDEDESLNEINDRTFYRITKREILNHTIATNQRKPKFRTKLKIRLFTRLGKKLGIWQKNQTLSENVRKVKYHLKDFNADETIQNALSELKIDVKKLKIDELILCPDGSVAKKYVCYQCPRGNYQDAAYNRCVPCPLGTYNNESGQGVCKHCPANYSTRKMGRIKPIECKQLCPPGTAAKVRIPRRRINIGYSNSHSLMPFCRKCNPGDYQSRYDQIECQHCPYGYDSLRGSKSQNDCTPRAIHPCQRNTTICGKFGFCVPENGGSDLFSCICLNGFIGSHCEQQLNLCLAAPCHNNGKCYYSNSTTISCECSSQYRGEFCEELKYSCSNTFCHNGGICIETDDDINCDCSPGFKGKLCEQQMNINYCNNLPCENGKCINTPGGYLCQCPAGIIGKRCHLKPCDHFPCHQNAICVDLLHYPATRESFMCKCPRGLKGYDCSHVHNPCDVQPCKNNGKCFPKILRQVGILTELIDSYELDDIKFSQYLCKCQPYFYGDNCEIFTTPDFIMNFPKTASTMNYVQIDGPIDNLNEISFCVWMKTNDSYNYGSIISYATDDIDNAFTLTDYAGFVLYVNGQNIVTDIIANDGEWHFVCVTWQSLNGFYEIYFDGMLEHSGFNLSQNLPIQKNGIFIIGQEQDTKGGGFSETESFIGQIGYLDIWYEYLKGYQIQEFYNSCEPYRGSLYSWTDFKQKIHGDILIGKSQFCQQCDKNLTIPNGYVKFMNQYQAIYLCNLGYKMIGNNIRNCLRTSKWSANLPYCQIVECEYLMRLEHGNVDYTGNVYRSYAEYTCDYGFNLIGSKRRTCLATGKWSGIEGYCISKIKCKILTPPNGIKIVYSDDNGILNQTLREFQIGTFGEISCGLSGNGDAILICGEDGEWDGVLPENCNFKFKSIINRTPKSIITTKSNQQSTTSILTKYSKKSFTDLRDSTTKKFVEHVTTTKPTIATTTKLTTTTTKKTTKIPITTKKATTTVRTTTTTTKRPIPVIHTTKTTTTTKRTTPKTTATTTKTTTAATTTRTTKKPTTKKLIIQTKTTTKKPTTTTTKRSTTTTTIGTTFKPKLITENDFISSITTNNKTLPDKQFWINLKNYLFYGCDSIHHQNQQLVLCKNEIKSSQLEDLTDFEPPETKEFHGIDVKLLNYIKNHTNFIISKKNVIYEEFFSIILYGNESQPKKLTKLMENSLRFALCIYIDTIIWDGTIRESAEDDSSVENITGKLKSLILKNSIPVFNDYKNRITLGEHMQFTTSPITSRTKRLTDFFELTTIQSETATDENWFDVDDDNDNDDDDNGIPECVFEDIRKIPENGYISEAKDAQLITRDFFSRGEKLYLVCNHGYRANGNPEILCQSNGEFTNVLARCSKLSCGKPKLKSSVKIIRGRSFRYNDEVFVQCADKKPIMKLICESNGLWYPTEIC